MISILKPRSLQSLVEAYVAEELRPNPEFQRGLTWTRSQQQGLIDSLLRGYQIPIFYVHLERRNRVFTATQETKAWIVDGQQRLASIVSYCKNDFALPDPKNAKPGTALPVDPANIPSWAGRKFQELDGEDRDRLLSLELLVVEITAEKNEVRDLFIRLQAGTPLTAQEKRDAYPGDFTEFIIKHAGKPGHRLSHPKPFFDQFRKSKPKRLTVADGEHYVDGRAEVRKFFAGLAMTVMLRESAEIDFVDLKGKTINEFYLANLDLPEGDEGALRVVRLLDLIATLPKFADLKEGSPMTFQMAFHFGLLVDSLDQGNYTSDWKSSVVEVFLQFKAAVAAARLQHRQTQESLPHHERFGRLLSGSGSDTAEIIRMRHAFMLSELYPLLNLTHRDPNRCFDTLEKEVIWSRDRGRCQNLGHLLPDRKVPFREARFHHIVEHAVGGQTVLRNGVLVCADCHDRRAEMQQNTSYFQGYIARIYSDPGQPVGEIASEESEEAPEQNDGQAAAGLRIRVDWGVLDIDRRPQVFAGNNDTETIVAFLRALLDTFKAPMREQLMEEPIIRFPLSPTPTTTFLSRAKNKPYPHVAIPGTSPVLYFCPQSQRSEKLERLKALCARLTLPDDSEFPEDCITVWIEGA